MGLKDIKDFIDRANKLGIPIPMARDPKIGVASVTLSLVMTSAICVIISLVSDKVDKSGALSFHALALGSYLGRKVMTGDAKEK